MISRLALIVVLALSLGGPIWGQEETEATQEPAAAAGPERLDAIDRMLQEDEEVLEGSGYTYDSEDRRDPFRSLLSVREQPEILGPRPDGVAGLLIEEVNVTGVFVTGAGPVAQVQSADKTKSYLVRQGDELYDGDVLTISFTRNESAEVVFRQDVRDPTAPKPFREVVKKLTP
ncbi:MAG: hypothetical protein VYE73_03640 [Acidobacteriota bacterium]|nr:hypothetical protein [Acidobacteriota bacterium]